jgi:DNA-binding SARP family transcriptional activator/TolB-like protein
MTYRLSLFGPPTLRDGGGIPASVPEKTFPLVAYLLLSARGGFANRAPISAFLWETADTNLAATNLRSLLARIRDRQRQLGFAVIQDDRGPVRLVRSSVRIDLMRFLEVVSQDRAQDISELSGLYSGDLLEHFASLGSEYDHWLQLQRSTLRDTFVRAVSARLEPADETLDPLTIMHAAQRVIEADPYNEVACRALMRIRGRESRPAQVAEYFYALQARLSHDLGVKPAQQTIELFNTLTPPRPSQPARAANSPDETDSALIGARSLPGSPIPGLAVRIGAPRITILPPPGVAHPDYHHQLAHSLIEDVTLGLCRSNTFSVVAPYTARELSNSGKRDLFATFGIDYAVETRLQNRGGERWLSIKLIDARTREILWPGQVRFDRAHLAEDYRLLSAQILSSLTDKIESIELARYDVEQDATAYHMYLRGQRWAGMLDLPHVRRARRAFKATVASFPDFVPALSGAARTYQLEWVLTARGDQDLLTEAARFASRSIEVDPEDARGFRELGACNLYAGHFDDSLAMMAEAERRNPQFADLLLDFGDALTHAGQAAEALKKITKATVLNPLAPDYYWWTAAGAKYFLHEYSDAIKFIERMRDQTPAFRLLAACWARLGERDLAVEYVRKVLEIHPAFSVRSWLSILPIRDPQYEKDYEDGLREAGFQ